MKKKFVLCLILMILITGCGKDIINQKDLKEGLDKYINSEYNEEEYEASLENGKINVNYEEENYTLKYNLKKGPTFTYEIEIEKGITYEEYLNKTNAISLPMLGYIASAYTYGVGVEDAYTYFALTYLEGMFDNYEEEKYIVVYEEDELETEAEIILVSEFGDKVIDYMKSLYEKSIKITDKENDTYTYELSSKCGNKSCTLEAKLTINPEGKFEKINGYADEIAKESMYEDITPESADYNIELKVGQTIEISGKNLNGYELVGMDVVNIDDEYNFTAIKEGIANGYFYIGEDDLRTFYITVVKAKDNEELETKTLKVK